MENNKFDIVMDYIDANIHKDTEIIKKGIYRMIGYTSKTFGEFFSVLTGISLHHYITVRKLYLAGQDLKFNTTRSIAEIALEYGYSEHSAFTRAIKTYFGCTPREIQKGETVLEDNKMNFSDFSQNTNKKGILESWTAEECLNDYKMSYIAEVETGSQQYGLDLDVCYAIGDIAYQLGVPAYRLIGKCFDLILEQQEAPLSQEEEYAISCGIKSYEELQDICKYFQCEFYDLDKRMVDIYREQKESYEKQRK